MNQLEILRESLGQCDEIILDALIMRNRIIEDIMSYKEANDIPILQPEQEAKQKEWLERRMADRRHKAEVEDVFGSITQNSKRIQARKLFNYNIVLIGFMGAGKSTISEFLKTAFAMDVIEMDQIIAEREGMSISDIFEVYGEQYFRDLETNLLIEMQSRTNVVISCGGGTPMRECNVVEMKKNGRVVLLTAKPETILDRVKDSHDRPLIENNKTVPFIAELMEKRREKYEAAADIVIETDAESLGIPKENIFIMHSGDVMELNDESAEITGKVHTGAILVDGLGVGDVGNIVLRDRQHLAEDGIMIVVLTLEKYSNQLLAGPDIVSRGFVYVRESEDLMGQAKSVVEDAIDSCLDRRISDWGKMKGVIKDSLGDFLWKRTKRKPMILPIIMEA